MNEPTTLDLAFVVLVASCVVAMAYAVGMMVWDDIKERRKIIADIRARKRTVLIEEAASAAWDLEDLKG